MYVRRPEIHLTQSYSDPSNKTLLAENQYVLDLHLEVARKGVKTNAICFSNGRGATLGYTGKRSW